MLRETGVTMARLDWSKLHSKILRSSIWLEDPIVRLVWICAIADSEVDGTFFGSHEVLARAWNLPEADVRRGLERLCAPDPKSGTPDYDGRRIIEESPNQWRVLNKRLYNKSGEPVGSSTERVQRLREKLAEQKRLATIETGNASNGGNGIEEKRLEESRTDQNRSDKRERERFAPPTLDEVKSFFEVEKIAGSADAFFYHFAENEWLKGNGKPVRNWKLTAKKWGANETGRYSRPAGARNPDSYPTTSEIRDFNKAMVGANAEHYAATFRATFGCDPRTK